MKLHALVLHIDMQTTLPAMTLHDRWYELYYRFIFGSSHLRFNVATCIDARVIEFLQCTLQAVPDNVVALPSRHAV